MARVTLFDETVGVPDRTVDDGFRISGFNLVIFFQHQVNVDTLLASKAAGNFPEIQGNSSYVSKLRSGAGLRYSSRLGLENSSADVLVDHSTRLRKPLSYNLIHLDDSATVLTAVPICFQVGGLQARSGRRLDFDAEFELFQPATTLGLLEKIRIVTQPDFLSETLQLILSSLKSKGVEVRSSRVLEAATGVDIWSLAGCLQRDDTKEFEFSIDAARYSWSLSAVVNHTSDHIVNGFGHGRNPAEIRASLSDAYAFMSDHIVFLSNSCCLEVTHFGDWTPMRSWDRMRDYGYDSSSIYLYALALLRSVSYLDVASRYGEHITTLTSHKREAVKFARLNDETVRDSRLLDALEELCLALHERRSQEFDGALHDLLGDAARLKSARARLDSTRFLVRDHRARLDSAVREAETRRMERTMRRLTFFAALFAVASLPGAIDLFASLWRDMRWSELATIASVVVVAVGLAVLSFQSRGSKSDVQGGW